MPYQVDWDPAADDQLINLWLNAEDRHSVARASHRIDQVLEQNPQLGTHLSEGLYRIAEPPLVAYYAIDDLQHTVQVSEVRPYRAPI